MDSMGTSGRGSVSDAVAVADTVNGAAVAAGIPVGYARKSCIENLDVLKRPIRIAGGINTSLVRNTWIEASTRERAIADYRVTSSYSWTPTVGISAAEEFTHSVRPSIVRGQLVHSPVDLHRLRP